MLPSASPFPIPMNNISHGEHGGHGGFLNHRRQIFYPSSVISVLRVKFPIPA